MHINAHVQIAKTSFEKPDDALTDDESASIFLYTLEFSDGPSLYQLLHKSLRSESRENEEKWFPYLKLFSTATKKLPPFRDRIFRGVPGLDLRSQYQQHLEFVWHAVLAH